MSSNITLNIVEPGSAPVAPNTGLFTSGVGGPEATIITVVSAVLMLTIVAIVLAVLYKKHKKQNKTTKLVHMVDTCKSIAKSKKRITAGLSAIALLASAGTFATLLSTANKNNTSAAEAEDGLTLDISGGDITIELADEPVFAIAEVKATVKEATQAGYTLTAYTDNTDLVSTTDESKTIPMITVDEGELAALADNTYGLTLAEPASQAEEVYTALSTDADNPTLLAEKDEGTEADDTTTIYYGFYITPDTPYGTYTSSDITYEAKENEVATVAFDGNGLYFNGNEEQTENIAKYVIETSDNANKYSHTPNVDDNGENDGPVKWNTQVNEIVTIPSASKLHIKYTYGGGYTPDYGGRLEAFASFWEGSHADYTPSSNYAVGVQKCGDSSVTDGRFYSTDGTSFDVECDVPGNTATFGYWSNDGGPGSNAASYGYYAVITGYDADGNIIYLPENNMVSGDYLTPASDSYYRFLGWSKSSESTAPEYVTEDDIKNELALTLGETTTLYAIWEPAFTISYNGNGADSTTNMDNVEQYTTNVESTSQVDLLASNFKKEGHGFAGWSTDKDAASKINSTGDDKPTIYGPNQTITVNPTTSTKLNLYAVWVPAETSVTMQTFTPNSEPYATKPNGTVIALKDERDEEVYAVAKLADGNYWMIENLRLDNEPELSANNTHNPNLPLTNNYEEQTKSNKLSASSDSWCNSWSTAEEQIACYDHSNLNTNNVANTVASPTFSQDFTSEAHKNFDGNIASYGNYYNWYSATAGQGTYSVGSGNAAGDICPTGWQLPYGGSSTSTGGGNTKGGFYYLNQQMGGGTSATDSNNWRSFPNNFVYSGYWYGSSASNRGSRGYYWSSTAYGTGDAYNLYFSSGYVDPGTDYSSKGNGNSVRCVAPVE